MKKALMSNLPPLGLTESQAANRANWLFDRGPNTAWTNGLLIRVLNYEESTFCDMRPDDFKNETFNLGSPLWEVPYYEGRE